MTRPSLAIVWFGLSIGLLGSPVSVRAADEAQALVTPDGGRYFGALVDGKRHGPGRIEWSNGASFDGGFREGLFSGKGRLRFPTGDVYEGDFAKGMESGRGRLTSKSGAVYEGEFRDGVLAGTGRYDSGNGTVYEGEFKDSLYHGKGRIVGAFGEYAGEFQLGEISGKGEMRFKDGRTFVGDFAHGDFEGKGRLAYPSGQIFEGDFVAGEFTGSGVATWPGGMWHAGRFRNWRPEGPGIFSDDGGTTYEGSFANGELTGSGRIVAKDGSRYEGETRNRMPHGNGELRLANGNVYRGGFEFGVFAGQGTMTYATPQSDGRTRDEGIWQHGRLKKEHEEERRLARANVELALYKQPALLADALREFAPRDARGINMYLLAVAGDGSQEVFRREVEFVRKQFDMDFGTRGRSLVLGNSRNTVGRVPLATVTSIRQAISAASAAMDKEQDILFLYITSHGSKEREITLGLTGMDLPPLSARELGEALKESGIRWKVVVISACYAGGFIDDLRDSRTLVITASRHDRRSFGCADENDFTYFGRAFFKEALPKAASFQDAYAKADRLITEWEDGDAQKNRTSDSAGASKDDERHSLPQMEDSPDIRNHLKKWWAQIAATPKNAHSAPGPAAGTAAAALPPLGRSSRGSRQ